MSKVRIKEILAEMQLMSKTVSDKTTTMWVQPRDEAWAYELDFSDDELKLAQELASELHSLMEFRVTFPLFPYEAK